MEKEIQIIKYDEYYATNGNANAANAAKAANATGNKSVRAC